MRGTIETLTDIVWDWGVRCFGLAHMNNKPLRALRFAEEALELAQACGVPEDKAAELVRVVYSRPKGSPFQEVGGSLVTLAVLGRLVPCGLEEAFDVEVRRCLSKSPEEFAARNREKLLLGLDAPLADGEDAAHVGLAMETKT